MQLYYDILPSPVGDLLIITQESTLIKIVFQTKKQTHTIKSEWIQGSEFLKQIKDELNSYFAGDLKQFSIQVNPHGTPFQKQIWKEVMAIPHGQVCSYQDVANNINKASACRAVGRANSQNPIPIIIPCHRVIGKNGKLTGYAGGLNRKQTLLELEGINTEHYPNQYKLF
ncbi:methylated-DNA--[protein]-cysteine S-methyltransferase [Ancylomarina sp. 16SWW S1-10-2]|uniref:methylated-DNA--[protein]-cysteine S-methyltransferase n=1 Tax=Ancylomarina sp. 16SWW S1-10-2 TaxID=2499681 RepID=UPI0012AD75FC|nr:methylated-DNA--[protein]-cysteine S-methyltransferase [Ancylomarina sp. 16SWW S1-10-2]MRT93558.1 methylated-DNA--[protein]-cysteine S-methyltransferase [Ancylomarina sp. 16SWW S1-10-2]